MVYILYKWVMNKIWWGCRVLIWNRFEIGFALFKIQIETVTVMYTCVRHCTYNGTFKYKIDQKWHFERSLVKPIRPLGRNIARREREKTAKTDFFLFWSIRWQDRLGAKTRNRSSRRPPLNLHAKVTSLFILTPRERIYRRYHQNKQKINQNGYENEHTVEYTSSYSYCICYYWTYWSFRNANLTLFCPVLIMVPISVPDQALGSIPNPAENQPQIG